MENKKKSLTVRISAIFLSISAFFGIPNAYFYMQEKQAIEMQEKNQKIIELDSITLRSCGELKESAETLLIVQNGHYDWVSDQGPETVAANLGDNVQIFLARYSNDYANLDDISECLATYIDTVATYEYKNIIMCGISKGAVSAVKMTEYLNNKNVKLILIDGPFQGATTATPEEISKNISNYPDFIRNMLQDIYYNIYGDNVVDQDISIRKQFYKKYKMGNFRRFSNYKYNI